MLRIREMTAGDIPALKDFAPPEWHVDLSVVFGRHFGQPYFHPIAAEQDGRVVGCANGLLQGNAGWLGNIIVLPECRGRGVGSALTEILVRFFQAQHMRYQILIATSLGEPVYRRLGFQVVSQYIFFARSKEASPSDAARETRALRPEDEEALFALDREVTGESRQEFLRAYLEGARVHVGRSGKLDGYFLPSLSAGLLIASNDEAGLALLRYRLSQPGSVSVVPERNRVAIDFLRANGFAETSRAPRMTLGPDIDWQPERVYCRGSGFCG